MSSAGILIVAHQGIVAHAVRQNSLWLWDAAFRQATRLETLDENTVQQICKGLIALTASGIMRHEARRAHTHLSRLDQRVNILPSFRLILFVPGIDIILHCAAIFMALLHVNDDDFVGLSSVYTVALLVLSMAISTPFKSTKEWRLYLKVFIAALFFLAYFITPVTLDYHISGISSVIFDIYYQTFAVLMAGLSGGNRFVLILSFFAIVWAPSAIVLIPFRKFSRKLFWPFLPLILVCWSLVLTSSAIAKIPIKVTLRLPKFKTVVNFLKECRQAFIIPIVLLVLIWLKKFDQFKLFSTIALDIINYVFFLSFIWVYFSPCFDYTCDTWRWRGALKESRIPINSETVLKHLLRFKSHSFCLSWLRQVSRSGNLRSNEQNLNILKVACAEMQNSITNSEVVLAPIWTVASNDIRRRLTEAFSEQNGLTFKYVHEWWSLFRTGHPRFTKTAVTLLLDELAIMVDSFDAMTSDDLKK